MTEIDIDAIDYLPDEGPLTTTPTPTASSCASRCPVTQEPYHDVFMVTGYDEAIAAYHDQATFSNCISAIGPFAKFPVPLEGDDITGIIETYRDELPFGDQLPAFDPPKHTAQRGLLMRLITPKRLKENEEFMVVLADRQIDQFHARGRVRVHEPVRRPLHPARHRRPPRSARGRPREVPRGAHAQGAPSRWSTTPSRTCTNQFTAYIEECRRQPRDDVMTGLAPATFPDGTLPPGRRRDEDRRQPVRRRPGDHGPPPQLRPSDHGRPPRDPATASATTGT